MQRSDFDAAYFDRRAREEHEHASEAQTIEAAISHHKMATAYERRAVAAQIKAGAGATAFPQFGIVSQQTRWRGSH